MERIQCVYCQRIMIMMKMMLGMCCHICFYKCCLFSAQSSTLYDIETEYNTELNPHLLQCYTPQLRRFNGIDGQVLLAWHRTQSRLPATFPPRKRMSL